MEHPFRAARARRRFAGRRAPQARRRGHDPMRRRRSRAGGRLRRRRSAVALPRAARAGALAAGIGREPAQGEAPEGGRVRFGLVHRLMTDALATLGLLALVTSGELNRGITVAIVIGLILSLLVPERWQDRPLLRQVG